ncbi:hypothetical protein [Kaistella jeonii]|uniref:Uncharacterized protein n=2 Tax=Kaistella jeonii TaxID=266749 RepID=A0A0C1D690_9FLAO|nr:hypothetical protein [Kaistella jeonii]KIA89350.1 hypothetical protein OA86_07075 [Kaistella jeonii]
MKYQFLLLLLLSLSYSAQKAESSNLEKGKATFEFHKITEPSLGTGVLGMQTKKAFAIFIDQNSKDHSPEIFNKVQFESMNFDGKKSTIFLCIYEDENGLPGKILNQAKILIETPSKKTTVIANLSSLKIKVPTNAYFIGFEWILSKENIINGAQNAGAKPYNPAISGIQIEKPNLYFFDKKWQKDKELLSSSLKIDVDYVPEN